MKILMIDPSGFSGLRTSIQAVINGGKNMSNIASISVFGLGYVGAVSAACIANAGYDVIGMDINEAKVRVINNWKSPIVEPGLEQLIQKSSQKGKLKATMDAVSAVMESDISLICVGTPSKENGDLDISYILRVIKEIGKVLAKKKGYHLIVIRSTILPGTTQQVIIPLLEKTSQKSVGKDIGICINPEFLREGSSIRDFYNPPYVVIGEIDEKSGKILKNLWISLGINTRIYNVEIKVAEMIKYASNAFHALKVVFANEIGSICKSLRVDSHKVMDIFVKDKILNLSSYYLKPGFAFGGSCLPKDLRALTHLSKIKDITSPVLNAILASNEHQVKNALRLIYKTDKKNVGILGLAFKPQTDDVRESPLVNLAENLLGKGYAVRVYEKNVNLQMLIGTNKEYLEKKIPHIITLLENSFEEILDYSDVLVIGSNEDSLIRKLEKADLSGKIIIDLVRIVKNPDEFRIKGASYEGIGW